METAKQVWIICLNWDNLTKIKTKPTSKSCSKHAFKNIQKQLRRVLFPVTFTVPPWAKGLLFFAFAVKEPETEMALVFMASESQKLVFPEPAHSKSHPCSFPSIILFPGTEGSPKSVKSLRKRCHGRQEGAFLQRGKGL